MPKRWSWRAARCRARCYFYEAAMTTHKWAETFIYILVSFFAGLDIDTNLASQCWHVVQFMRKKLGHGKEPR